MPSIPLPFVICLVLCLILVRMLRQADRSLGLFPLLVASFALQAAMSGLSWNIGWHPAHLIQPVIAAWLPALSFAAFRQLSRNGRVRLSDLLPHLLPAVLTALLVAFWREPLDAVLFVIYLGYGLALLRIARQGPEALCAVRIADEWTAYRALVAMAIMLIVTAFLDALVSLDFAFGDGRQAPTLLGVASVLWLAIAGYAATIADNARPEGETDGASEGPSASSQPPPQSIEDDQAIASRIDLLMREQHLYRDPDLTLERLARRAGIPARQISGALNRVHGRNISQIVNEYRVGDAKHRLATTSEPVTTIMLESGFGTKSNFNREFLRVTGVTPSAFRLAAHDATSAAAAKASAP
ncbi:AraC family transcriptional regulator [Rhizobium sp. NRK18]|uniref:AraC family transcriptional regulator n=1 Tax=Rhizobium sp. NRK18 TaxID=2964667 RepID=UPI0021C283B9|nr:AraC family transcriptional regulator [Rhizobium sp. NRK18]MCQ2004383.1 AraC family transcriptional regulator [Rhizobium sp. NRK18]